MPGEEFDVSVAIGELRRHIFGMQAHRRQAQAFADNVKEPKMGWAKEFYQLSFRIVGLERRLGSLRDAIALVKGSEVVRKCMADDSTRKLANKYADIDKRLGPLDRKIKHMSRSFLELNAMVRMTNSVRVSFRIDSNK